MRLSHLAALALLAALAPAAEGAAPTPRSGFGPAACPIAPATIIAASTSTARVPRMGPGSELLTQHATIQNPGAAAARFEVTVNHRAFQQGFVAGQTFTAPANGQLRLDLGNVLKPGLTVADLRATTTFRCVS